MGLDLNQLFGDAYHSAQQGMSDVLQQGGNAALGYLEQQAVNLINTDKQQHDEAAQSSIKKMLSTQPSPNSFGSYFSNLVKAPAMQQYGGSMIAIVAVVAIGGFLLLRK